MLLTQKKHSSIKIISSLIFLLFLILGLGYGMPDIEINVGKNGVSKPPSLISAKKQYDTHEYHLAIRNYKRALKESPVDSVSIFKELAFSYAKTNQAELASEYIRKYVIASLDVSFVGHSYFDEISRHEAYQVLSDEYLKKVGPWSIFCFYVAFIGFFISIVLNFRERSDKVSSLLMSTFVFIHSFFILHLGLYFSNYNYYLPHTFYMSTSFSFLYGPLIYFYFKRVTTMRKFSLSDLWHVLPSILLIALLLPIYSLPAEEKLRIIVHSERPYMVLITISKLISLLVYGALVIKMFIQSVNANNTLSRVVYVWQRNVVIFCSIYITSYGIYSVLIIRHTFNGFLFYIQVVSMALLVLYVGYTAYVQPAVFGSFRLIKGSIPKPLPPEVNKYKKSGLTESLSLELKEKLLYLLNKEKIYKQNDITLQKLAEHLDTTRHNASQIINEHFNLNFFELINKYRIEEAKELLKREKHKNFNIIDVAYEVGFNNKVTFNKSFKKYNHITPSEYVRSFVA